MTNLEAIQSKVGLNYPIDDPSFKIALIESNIDESAQFQGGKAFDWALVNVVLALLASAKRISEGGYTVEINSEGLETLLTFLFKKHGWIDPRRPTLKAVNAW